MSGSTQTPASTATQPWTVKQVISGDCIVLREQPRGAPPSEKQVFLAHIKAGRVGRSVGDKVEQDEPFGWAAREFLRKKLVGKEVQVQVDFRTQQNREYCWVFFNLPNSNEMENIVESLVREGLVEVRPAAGGRAGDAAFQKLMQLEEAAKAGGKGKWSSGENITNDQETASSSMIRSNVKWSLSAEELRRFVDANKGKELPAVVEYVRDASTLRVCTLGTYNYFWVQMTGIRSPGYKQSEDATAGGQKQTISEPFADEARFFVESRLLQRDVTLTLDGVSNQYAVATVQHPRGLIAELLVQEGFARCVDWSLTMLNTRLIERLRTAERTAKEKRSRIWKDYVPTRQTASGLGANEKEYSGRVIEIGATADWLIVRKADGESKKIWFASVRGPRATDFETGAQKPASATTRRPLYDVPYVFEARELLRKKLLGQEVLVQVDYVQAADAQPQAQAAGSAQPPRPERVCCTVTHAGSNVAEQLVSRGLFSVLRYRANDENRSRAYDALLAAEAKAQSKAVGMHDARTEPPVLRITELAGDANRSKQFFSFLKRAGRATGVVEFVASGSRVRVHVPKESVLITLLLDGIECPRASFTQPGSQNEQRGDEFGDIARDFTRSCAFQRDVQVEVNTMDRAGNFVGSLFVTPELVRSVNPQTNLANVSSPVNLSVALVEAGLARVHAFSAERTTFNKELLDAQEIARQNRIGLWSKTVETETKATGADTSVDEAAIADDDATLSTRTNGEATLKESTEPSESTSRDTDAPVRRPGRKTNFREVVITETDSNMHFFVQYVSDGPRLLEWTSALRRELADNPPVAGAYRPAKNEVCLARYSFDNEWYRARIEKVSPDGGQAQLRFIDYGNCEIAPSARLARLPTAYALSSIPQASHECALAFVTVPTDEEDRRAMREVFNEAVQRTLVVNVEYTTGGVSFVTIAPRDDLTDTINKQLIADGYAVVDTAARRDAAARQVLVELQEAQESAKSARLNLWRYGDFTGTVV